MGLAASGFYKWFKFSPKKKSQSQCALSFTKLYTRDEASSSSKRLSLKNRPGPLSHTHLFHACLPISMVLGQMFGGWDTFSQKVFLKTKVVRSHKRGSSGSKRCFFTFRQRALFKTRTIILPQVFFPSASCSLFERSGRLVKPLVIHPYSFGMSRHAIWRKRLNRRQIPANGLRPCNFLSCFRIPQFRPSTHLPTSHLVVALGKKVAILKGTNGSSSHSTSPPHLN